MVENENEASAANTTAAINVGGGVEEECAAVVAAALNAVIRLHSEVSFVVRCSSTPQPTPTHNPPTPVALAFISLLCEILFRSICEHCSHAALVTGVFCA